MSCFQVLEHKHLTTYRPRELARLQILQMRHLKHRIAEAFDHESRQCRDHATNEARATCLTAPTLRTIHPCIDAWCPCVHAPAQACFPFYIAGLNEHLLILTPQASFQGPLLSTSQLMPLIINPAHVMTMQAYRYLLLATCPAATQARPTGLAHQGPPNRVGPNVSCVRQSTFAMS